MMTIDQMADRLQSLFPDFDRSAFNQWWVTKQPLLNGRAPSQADPSEVANLVVAVENFHASNKGDEE